MMSDIKIKELTSTLNQKDQLNKDALDQLEKL